MFQEQARPQLGLNFGSPRNPECSGLTLAQMKQMDFDKMDLSEWINMLKITQHLPLDSASADVMYDKGMVTKGKLRGTQNQNTQDRLNTQTKDSDLDGIRQHLLDNL